MKKKFTHIKTKENFVQTPKRIITDRRLISDAKVLYQLIQDTPPNVSPSLSYYYEQLGWGKKKGAKASKNLQENGYLKINKFSNGTSFTYYFTISDFGNLNNNFKVEIKEEIRTPNEVNTKTVETIPNENYKSLTEKFISNLSLPLIDKFFNDIMNIRQNNTKFLKFKTEIEILIKETVDEQRECFKFYKKNTKGLENETKKIQTIYTDWLKEEIFVKGNLEPDAYQKWQHIKINNKKKKIDYETQLLND